MKPGVRFYRRRLPHLEKEGATYFVTFSTLDRRTLSGEARGIILGRCCYEHERRAIVHTAVVMPDHVHLLMSPLDDDMGEVYSLKTILRGIKGASARLINKSLGRKGSLWQHESFDHLLRGDESIEEKVEYLCQNPVRRGLAEKPEEYPWLWRLGVQSG
jgi:REP-associated tyrosine transposase